MQYFSICILCINFPINVFFTVYLYVIEYSNNVTKVNIYKTGPS